MGQGKLLVSIVAGAAIGAALSMLDRTTREKTIDTTKKMKEAVTYYATNRRITGPRGGKSTGCEGAL